MIQFLVPVRIPAIGQIYLFEIMFKMIVNSIMVIMVIIIVVGNGMGEPSSNSG